MKISFKGRHFFKDIILMAVRWYLAYSLSYRDIEELMLERGIKVDHATINRWVIKYSPQLLEAFKVKKKPVNGSWRMDETYVKVKGKWHYLYRAVDKLGNTIDFLLTKNRNKKAAKRFFNKAIKLNGIPEKITIDKSGANKSGIDAINKKLKNSQKIEIRQKKYLNNIVEQDHRFIKKIIKPTKGFKSFSSASATLSGIELHHMLRKQQHKDSSNQNIFEQFYYLAA
ncbi:MAG: IS6 family transposase [Gammaproteobacteria bacterium]